MLNKKIIPIAIVLVFVVGAVVAFAATRSDSGTIDASRVETGEKTGEGEASTQTTPATETSTEEPEPAPKSDTPGDSFPQPPAPAVPPEPSDTSGLAYLGASVTAQQSLADDSIDILFYVQGPSYFTIQELVSGSWITLGEGIYYPGTGGLLAGQLAPGEESKTVRLLMIENDQYVAATNEFTVLRSDVASAGGIVTYSD